MNYKNIYNKIIEHRKNNPHNGYTESHHIVPRSIGGSDDKNNIVNLSAREHFICHLLLTKMFEEDTPEYYKMIKAFMMMLVAKSSKHNNNRFISSRHYAFLREKFSLAQQYFQGGEKNSQYGRKKTEETKRKIADGVKKRLAEKGIIGNKKEIKKEKNKLKRQKKVDIYTKYYILYKEVGWSEFKKQTGYDKTLANFIQESKKFAPTMVEKYKVIP